jgi:hypothetical protein
MKESHEFILASLGCAREFSDTGQLHAGVERVKVLSPEQKASIYRY